MDKLNKKLYQVCYEYAEGIKLEPEPVIAEIEKLAMVFYKAADHFELVCEEKCDAASLKFDSELLIRAISYMSHTHAHPGNEHKNKNIMAECFKMQLKVLIELAYPNVIQTKESAEFFEDIRKGIKLSKSDII